MANTTPPPPVCKFSFCRRRRRRCHRQVLARTFTHTAPREIGETGGWLVGAVVVVGGASYAPNYARSKSKYNVADPFRQALSVA